MFVKFLLWCGIEVIIDNGIVFEYEEEVLLLDVVGGCEWREGGSIRKGRRSSGW